MKKLIVVIIVIILTTTACSVNMGSSTGGVTKMDEAGFSAEVPNGFEMSSTFGDLSFTEDGADLFAGPHFSISVSPSETYNDANAMLDSLSGSNNVFNYVYSGNRGPVMIGDLPGLAEDFTGVTEEDGVAIAGRVVVAILPDGRHFQFSGHWPADRQEESVSIFESTLKGIQFYEPVKSTPGE